MKIGRRNVRKASDLNAKFNPSTVLDIEIDVDEYRGCTSSAILGGVNNKDFQQIRDIYKEYEQDIEDIIASKIADMVPTEMSEYIEELRRLEYEVVNAKDLLDKKQFEKYHAKDDHKKRIIDAEIMTIKDELENKKIELSRFISKNKDVKLSSDLVMLDYELNENLNDIISEIDDITLALSAQINILKALRGFVYDSKKIVRQQLSKRLGCYIDSRFKQLINEETPLLMIVSNKKVLE